ncbi:MAG TPA: hypothetical protein PKA27_16855 [Fimbriimonadaceae bacterium]|nr:hypothetical protein [Fimbriimonadaceae bacterium]
MDSNELQEVLKRAQEIERSAGLAFASPSEVESFVSAATEAGISKEAVLQALQERLGVPHDGFKVGETVFAKGADKHFYAATILEIDEKWAKVQFANGSEHRCSILDLRSFSLVPGQSISYFAKDYMIWMNGPVGSYDPVGKVITINEWGTEQKVPLEKIRIVDKKAAPSKITVAQAWAIALLSGSFGAVAGAILMRILMR